ILRWPKVSILLHHAEYTKSPRPFRNDEYRIHELMKAEVKTASTSKFFIHLFDIHLRKLVMKKIFHLSLVISATIASLFISCAVHKPYPFPLDTMTKPPGGYETSRVPMFVSFGVDDNPYSGLEGSGGGGGM